MVSPGWSVCAAQGLAKVCPLRALLFSQDSHSLCLFRTHQPEQCSQNLVLKLVWKAILQESRMTGDVPAPQQQEQRWEFDVHVGPFGQRPWGAKSGHPSIQEVVIGSWWEAPDHTRWEQAQGSLLGLNSVSKITQVSNFQEYIWGAFQVWDGSQPEGQLKMCTTLKGPGNCS